MIDAPVPFSEGERLGFQETEILLSQVTLLTVCLQGSLIVRISMSLKDYPNDRDENLTNTNDPRTEETQSQTE